MGYKEAMQQCDYLIDQLQQEMINQKAEDRAKAIVQERCPYCHEGYNTIYSVDQTEFWLLPAGGARMKINDVSSSGVELEDTIKPHTFKFCPMCGRKLWGTTNEFN